MGFFNFGKNKDTKETNHTSWESCHKAQPNMYEKDGNDIYSFSTWGVCLSSYSYS